MVTVPTTTITANYYLELVNLEVTAYTTSYEDCGKIDGITSSGTKVKYGVIAAPNEIAYGTEILIDGTKFVVEDRGSAIIKKTNGTYIIDMWLPTKEQCIQYGRQSKKGYIVRYKSPEGRKKAKNINLNIKHNFKENALIKVKKSFYMYKKMLKKSILCRKKDFMYD